MNAEHCLNKHWSSVGVEYWSDGVLEWRSNEATKNVVGGCENSFSSAYSVIELWTNEKDELTL